MSLNIKNPRVHDLAREAARRTGRTQTSVIELALERLLQSLPDETARREEGLDRLIADMQRRFAAAGPGLEIEDLYDDRGLPR